MGCWEQSEFRGRQAARAGELIGVNLGGHLRVAAAQRPADGSVLERLAVEKLHGDKCPPSVLADVVNRADLGMVQRGSRFGFAAKTFEACGSRATSSGKNLSATKRSNRVSWALYTTPIPPPPSFSTMR